MVIHRKNKIVVYIFFSIIGLFFFASPDILHALPSNKIIKTGFTTGKNNGETLTITLKRNPKFKYFTLSNPRRIVLDIYDTFLPGVRRTEIINSKTVKTLRMAQNTKGKTRIVLDIKKKTVFFINRRKIPKNSRCFLILHIACPVTGSEHHSRHKLPQSKLLSSNTGTLNSKIPRGIFDIEKTPAMENTSTDQTRNSSFLFSGSIQTRGAMDTCDNSGNEHSTSFRNRTILKFKYSKLLTVSTLSDYLYFGNNNPDHDYDFDLYEAYLTLPVSTATLILGKKILRWGKTDQISPVDTINPQDLREFIIPDYEERKIPVWMADLTMRFHRFTLEGVYIPQFKPDRQAYFGSDWGVYSHLKEDVLASNLPLPVKNYVNNIHVHENDPNDKGLNGEAALKITTTINDWDLGITYDYTWEDLPFYNSFPIKNIRTNGTMEGNELAAALGSAVMTNEEIQVSYPRAHIVGFEFETTIGDYGVRGEAAWQNRQSFLTSDLTSVRKPTLIYVIGADYSGSEWYINVQLSHNHIFDYDDSILYFKQDTFSLLGKISRKLNSDWFKVALNYSVALNDNEYYLSPRLICTYITDWNLTFGADIFGGNPATFIGRFNANDQLFLDATYHF